MKSTGVVRKIDDLGRIVIPKEIRKNLGIRDGESLEIVVEDNNIMLSKKNIINNYKTYISELCKLASLIIPGIVIVTDREQVTFVTKNEIINVGDKLSLELSDLIDNRMTFNDDKLYSFKIGDNDLTGYYIIYPIIDESSSLGLIIVYNSKEIINKYEIIIKFISMILSRKLDIS